MFILVLNADVGTKHKEGWLTKKPVTSVDMQAKGNLPMMAFFLSVSASFSTTFCFWMEMSSFVFSPSLSGRNSVYQLCTTKHVTVS